MILKASHHPVIYPFFKFYTLWKIRRNFHEVIIKGDVIEKGLPVLLISNHLSWWDGFWVMYLNIKLFHRVFWFMMEEENLRKYSFFNRTGGYSVRKGARSVIETLDYTAELLENPNNIVLIFPQGDIRPMRTEKITFMNGVFHVLKKTGGPIQVIFLVNVTEYFSNARPTLYMYIMEYNLMDKNTEDVAAAYQKFYEQVLSDFI